MASASIFTFDPDPPRVASPWAAATPPGPTQPDSRSAQLRHEATECNIAFDGTRIPIQEFTPVFKIEAEPQEGPVEYKLHLLLRGRRSFTRSSTGQHFSGSLRRSEAPVSISMARSLVDTVPLSTTPPPLSVTQSRVFRLEQLTSQMIWRLQQSSPHHTSSSSTRVNLHFSDEAQQAAPIALERLYPGLEESNGALYEIGVADNGELIGLAEDEMEESLNNLRIMAASLGCRVEVQRVIAVGDCEWVEYADVTQKTTKNSKLLVAEAFIRPDQHFDRRRPSPNPEELINSNVETSLSNVIEDGSHKTEQLRVSLTGATTSGKSSLLGTFSTGTLDDGKGLSRLSLLKHKHERESGGQTSSITQELIGYHDIVGMEGLRTSTQVINFGSTDHSSWTDIHTSAGSSTAGRVVFLTDSAGHPRFRRTTVRGLVGWDPHYTLLCVPGNITEAAPMKVGLSSESTAGDLDLTMEHIQLCLALDLPLLVVMTKLDLSTRSGIASVIKTVREPITAAGRKISIIADRPTTEFNADLSVVSQADLELAEVERAVQALDDSLISVVPIILTSSVSGNGLSKLHALLRQLPVPAPPVPPTDSPSTLFHIEDLYTKVSVRSERTDEPTIVGGHLRYGTLNIGDEILLGPYPVDASPDDSDSGSGRIHTKSSVPTSRSFPGALHPRSTLCSRSEPVSNLTALVEWRRVRIVSLRNLRQPVRTLHTGQVGTIGVSPVHDQSPSVHRIRKGMILANGEPQAKRVVSVRFVGGSAQAASRLSIGSAVFIYTASVRASSKVMSMSHERGRRHSKSLRGGDDEDGFGFGLDLDEDRQDGDGGQGTATVVTFQFIASREFIEADARALVMPGGGPGLAGGTEKGEKGVAGLEGFVGRVVDG
ncbi:hypothetical protein P280DRAFT_311071 [Massarina eburnea CBS 473.64]|uniref:Tr-type G domain-containing protein n=1 Tax=Massarina eburnea CBS 473.64 TaxID=1395130 RepID=A0A6A6S1I0_9PLEO|nr:hypothetical protein P280DRAFT_311071 [Massarina eburnea CBS 473.64]